MPAKINGAAVHSLSQAFFRNREGAKRSEQLQEVKERGGKDIRRVLSFLTLVFPTPTLHFTSLGALRSIDAMATKTSKN